MLKALIMCSNWISGRYTVGMLLADPAGLCSLAALEELHLEDCGLTTS